MNKVIASVNKDFTDALNGYCKDVEKLVRKTWQECKGKKDSMESFEKAMMIHCQENLYDANIKGIKEKIETSFIQLTSEYMANVRQVVTDEYEKLSVDAQSELNELFDKDDSGPVLRDVAVGTFERIKFRILGAIPFDWAQEKFIEQYSKRFIDQNIAPSD